MAANEENTRFAKFREDWSLAVLRCPDLTGNEKAVLWRLIFHRNGKQGTVEYGTAWPSARSLAEDSATSLPTARRALQKAERLGFLATLQKGSNSTGANRTSVRTFLIPNAEKVGITSDQGSVTTDHIPPDVGITSDQGGYHQRSGMGITTDHLTREGTFEGTRENYSSPTGVGGDPDGQDGQRTETDRGTTYPTDYNYFVDLVKGNPLLNDRLQAYARNCGVHPQEAYDNFYESCGEDRSTSWIKKFRGFTRDWAESHAA